MPSNSILNPSLVRHNNYRSILLAIRGLGSATVTAIAEKLALSKTAISKGIAFLADLGFVLPMGKEASSAVGGKPAELYTISPTCRFSCSVVHYGDLMTVSLFDFLGTQVGQASFPIPQSSVTAQELPALFCGWVEQVAKSTGITTRQLCGVVFLAGHAFLNRFYKSTVEIDGFKEAAGAQLGIPGFVYVEDPKDMRGYSELRADPARQDETLVVISVLRTEITGCVIDHGVIRRGHHGSIADFAHVTTDYSMSRTCSCGRKGCYGTIVKRDAILHTVTRELRAGAESSLQPTYQQGVLQIMDVVHAAEEGDPVAKKCMDRVLENHFNLIFTIYLILHPDEIIFQTGTASKTYHSERLNQLLQEADDPLNGRAITMRISQGTYEPFEATAIGAADFCVDQYLNNPACFEKPM